VRDKDGPYGLRKAVEEEAELAVVDSYYTHFLHASMRNSLVVLHMEGRVLLERLKGHQGEVNSLSVCGNSMASASADGSVRVWDLRTGK
jgi:WD40 repeat protein